MYNKGEKNMKTLVEQMALIQSLNVIDDIFFTKLLKTQKFVRRYCALF